MCNIIETVGIHINELNFNNKPIHINYKYRIVFQVARLVLVLGMASAKTGSTALKIQIISDALENEGLFDYLSYLIETDTQEFARSWRYNQALSRAISYSNAEGITQYSRTGKLTLTEKGQAVYNEIYQAAGVFEQEKEQLHKIKKKLSDTKLMNILEKGSI